MIAKIQIHSAIGLITNSSTEIFVHSEDSVEPAKELLRELLRIEDPTKILEDVFDIQIERDSNDLVDYFEYFLDEEIDEELYHKLGFRNNKVSLEECVENTKKYINDVSEGIINAPD
jgi:hypothetical protein